MPGDDFQKRRSGDSLYDAYKAPWHNALVDTVKRSKENEQNIFRKVLQAFRDADEVLVRNESGSARNRFDILGLDSPIITPADNLNEFKRQVAMVGLMPQTAHVGRFAVLLENVGVGEIGRGVVSGVVPVRVQIDNADEENYEWVEVRGGRADVLSLTSLGTGFVLWKEAGTGQKWAIVRLSNPQDFFSSSFSSSSGSSSTSSSTPSSSESSSSTPSSSGSSSAPSSSESSSSTPSSSSAPSSSESSSSSSSATSSSSSSEPSSSSDAGCVVYGPPGRVSECSLCLPRLRLSAITDSDGNVEIVCTPDGEDCFAIPCCCGSSSSSATGSSSTSLTQSESEL